MKNKVFIILSLLAMSLFFTKMDVYAVEDNTTAPYTVDCYTIQHNFDKNGQESTSENWRVVLSSSSPVDLYYFTTFDTPFSGDYIVRAYAVSESPINDSGTVFDYQEKKLYGLDVCYIATGFYSGNSGYIDFFGNGANEIYKLKNSYGDVNSFIYDYKRDGLDYEIPIDWNNPIYNENIGYLQNVGLKISGIGGDNFTLTWAVNNSDYLTDDFRVQIGWMTNFQESLLGDKKAYTNLNLISWDDELKYNTGRVEFSLRELWEMIPSGHSFSHNGYFLLRIIHADKKTGLYEAGGWGQIHWILGDGESDVVKYTPILSSSILEHTGVTENYEISFIEDTDAGGGHYINSANGSVDNFSTFIDNATKDWDLSEASNYFYNGISSIVNGLSQFPNLVSKVASFLPNEIMVIIGVSIVAIILLRFLGR